MYGGEQQVDALRSFGRGHDGNDCGGERAKHEPHEAQHALATVNDAVAVVPAARQPGLWLGLGGRVPNPDPEPKPKPKPKPRQKGNSEASSASEESRMQARKTRPTAVSKFEARLETVALRKKSLGRRLTMAERAVHLGGKRRPSAHDAS